MSNMILWGGILGGLVSLLIIILVIINRAPVKYATNSPKDYLKNKTNLNSSKKRCVCIGDSITHGIASANYVKFLQQKLGEKIDFINAGINSQLVYHVLRRLDEIIRCKPDYITILIGTNDANGSLNEKNQKTIAKRMKLPQLPTKEIYEVNLKELIQRLKNETQAKIGIFSLPTMGEDLNDTALNQSKQFSALIKQIAHDFNIEYFPLNEMMIAFLQNEKPVNQRPYLQWQKLIVIAVIKHFLLMKSWDSISKSHGFYFHSDHLHLNNKGASMVVDLIEKFLLLRPFLIFNEK